MGDKASRPGGSFQASLSFKEKKKKEDINVKFNESQFNDLFVPNICFSEQKLWNRYEGKVTCMHWETISEVFTLVAKTMGKTLDVFSLILSVCEYCTLNSESKWDREFLFHSESYFICRQS